MLSKRQLQRAKAIECRTLADSARDPGVRMAYERAAETWYRISAPPPRPPASDSRLKKPEANRGRRRPS
jgi:hypothetical protein